MHDEPSTNRKSIEYDTNVKTSMLLGIEKLTALFTECPIRVIISDLRHNITKYLYEDYNVKSFSGNLLLSFSSCCIYLKLDHERFQRLQMTKNDKCKNAILIICR